MIYIISGEDPPKMVDHIHKSTWKDDDGGNSNTENPDIMEQDTDDEVPMEEEQDDDFHAGDSLHSGKDSV